MKKTDIFRLITIAGHSWEVGEVIDGNINLYVEEIFEVFSKPIPMYRVVYSDGTWAEVPTTSVEFVRGGR